MVLSLSFSNMEALEGEKLQNCLNLGKVHNIDLEDNR